MFRERSGVANDRAEKGAKGEKMRCMTSKTIIDLERRRGVNGGEGFAMRADVWKGAVLKHGWRRRSGKGSSQLAQLLNRPTNALHLLLS